MNRSAQVIRALAPELRSAWGACRVSAAALALFSLCINLLWLVPSLYMLQVYDRVLTSGSRETLLLLSLMMLFLLVAMGVLEWVRSQMLVRIGERLHGLLAGRLFDLSFRQSLATGGQQSAAQPLQDLQGLRQFLTAPGLISFFDAPWLPLYTAMMFAFHPLYGWLTVLGAALLIGIAVLQEKRSAPLLVEASKEASASQATLSRTLANAEVIEGLGMAPSLRSRWDATYDRVLRLQTLASERAGVFVTSSRLIRLLLQSAVLGVGAWLVLGEQMSPGLMVAGTILLGRALAPVDQLTNNWKGFVTARTQLSRLNEWLNRIPAAAPRMPLPAPSGALTAEGLVVVPPGSQVPALRGISFRVEAGEAIGIIGASAAGKSTLARVLLGIWPAAQGRVRFDGAEVYGWDRAELGQHLGYLPQDVELFDGTVAQNIARFGEVDSERVVAAAQLAGVHDLVLRLPNGYDTPVIAVGGALTAGQRQRLGLARAVYGEPKIVVLDEPNSNLDEAGDAALVRALAQLKSRGTTLFVISHRSSILPAVEKLLVLRDGGLQDFGPRDEVRKRLHEAQAASGLQLLPGRFGSRASPPS